ncbi:MAG: retropepsin-like aspartic protease [Candidatus Omnitrophota bacterium]
MRNLFCHSIFLAAVLVLLTSLNSSADIVHFNNGETIEGIVRNEDEQTVDLEICLGGKVEFSKSGIKWIEKSSEEETQALLKKWQEQDQESRRKAVKLKEGEQQKLQKEVTENKDKKTEFAEDAKNIIVYATLNNKASAKLIFDTGASLVILKKKMADKLGIKFSELKSDAKLTLADGRKVNAKYIILEKVKVENAEADSVEAAIMLDEVSDVASGDGLLGMSFLKKFNFKIDHKNKKLILEKI